MMGRRLAAGVGLAACAAQLLEALDAAAGAEGSTERGFPRITAIVVGKKRREESHEDAKAQRWHEGEIGDWEIRREVKVGIVLCVWLRPGLASRRVSWFRVDMGTAGRWVAGLAPGGCDDKQIQSRLYPYSCA